MLVRPPHCQPLTSPIALKADDITSLKTKFNFPTDKTFYVPEETYKVYSDVATRGADLEVKWNDLLAAYGQKYPNEHASGSRKLVKMHKETKKVQKIVDGETQEVEKE